MDEHRSTRIDAQETPVTGSSAVAIVASAFEPVRTQVIEVLNVDDWSVASATDHATLNRALAIQQPWLLVVDMQFENRDGTKLMSTLRLARIACDVIFLAHSATPEAVVNVMRLGAIDVVSVPVDPRRLAASAKLVRVKRAEAPADEDNPTADVDAADAEAMNLITSRQLRLDVACGSITPIEAFEKSAILSALRATEGHVVRASKLLGLGQATLYRKLKRYSIDARNH